jgi:hypothetical protein
MGELSVTEDQMFLAEVAAVDEVKALLVADAMLDQLLSSLARQDKLPACFSAEIMLTVANCRAARAPFMGAINAYNGATA